MNKDCCIQEKVVVEIVSNLAVVFGASSRESSTAKTFGGQFAEAAFDPSCEPEVKVGDAKHGEGG